MKLLSIGMIDGIEKVKALIDNSMNNIEFKNISIKIREDSVDSLKFLDIEIKDEEQINKFKIYLANILSQFIIEKHEKKFIYRIIKSNYCYFSTKERNEIFKTSVKSVVGEDNKSVISSLFMLRRKNIIVKKLIEYLENSDEIVLDGFITFRLKDYMKELEDIVDKAVDDYLMQKEYREFICLLKYFVEIQEPKFNTVHVIVNYDGQYVLLDENKKEITNECIHEFADEISEGEINNDDLLISSLITIAPKRIYIHSVSKIKNWELINTIKNVFTGKVIFCEECDLCSSNEAKNYQINVKDYLHQ